MGNSHTDWVDFFDLNFRTWIKMGHFEDFLTGLHNAMCHGEVFRDADIPCTDKQLVKLFDGIELMLKTARKMDE